MNETVVTIPISLLENTYLNNDDIVAYARLKAGLPLTDYLSSIPKLKEVGVIKKKAKAAPMAMDAIRKKVAIIAAVDKRPYLVKFTQIRGLLLATGKEATLQVLVYHLKSRIEEKINNESGKMKFFLSKEWIMENHREASRLYAQYPFRAEKWEIIIDWFFKDEFWRDVITTVRTLNRHLQQYMKWEQKTKPSVTKSRIKVIGGE